MSYKKDLKLLLKEWINNYNELVDAEEVYILDDWDYEYDISGKEQSLNIYKEHIIALANIIGVLVSIANDDKISLGGNY